MHFKVVYDARAMTRRLHRTHIQIYTRLYIYNTHVYMYYTYVYTLSSQFANGDQAVIEG